MMELLQANDFNESEFKHLIASDFNRPPRAFPPKLLFPPLPFEDRGLDDRVAGFIFFRNWWWISLPISALYVTGIFLLEQYMKPRTAFTLRRPLIVWNALLAGFSIWCALRLLPVLLYDIFNLDVFSTICYTNIGCKGCGVTIAWMHFFVWSKLFELGDTVFIVLRKRPLIFLHWYHHISVLLYTWYGAGTDGGAASGLYYCATNTFIHSLMYSYYTFRAMGYHIPKVMQMTLTSLQILQMFLGITIAFMSYHYNTLYGSGCAASHQIIIVTIAMLISYVVLFSLFFYKTYVQGVKSSDALSPLALLTEIKNMAGFISSVLSVSRESVLDTLPEKMKLQ